MRLTTCCSGRSTPSPALTKAGQIAALYLMKVTYYLEVLSSWCHWVEPVWSELKNRYAQKVQFEWRIALMNAEDFPVSREQCDWFYRRSGGTVMRSSVMLNSGWMTEGVSDYSGASLVAEAGKDFGILDDRLRLALAHAALCEGKKVGDLAVAASVGAKASGIAVKRLRTRASSAAVRARVEASTADFMSHRISQRPAFVIENAIGDKAVFSGLVALNPLAATIDAMLDDAAAYAAHAAHYGNPPKA